MALRHWLQLSLTEGVGPILSRRMVEAAGSAEAACAASVQLLQNIEGIGTVKAGKIAAALRVAAGRVDVELARAAALGVFIICADDSSYSPLLKNIPDPPMMLYVQGTLEPRDLNAMAIVGSRKCSLYGREQAERFAALMAGAGFTVVSGGARGTDSAAHRGALSHELGRTVAVLGSGLDVAYPPENKPLFAQIAQRGAVISEFALGTPPSKENFPRRNRIISGLSRGVLVVEADERSGALITARQACDDHGRPVFALPGRIDNPLAAGPHKLIRDGAILATNLDDILEAIGPLPHNALEAESPPTVPKPTSVSDDTLTERQRQIIDALTNEPADVETIIDRTNLPAQVVMQELTWLSLKGRVKRVEGNSYVRAR